MRDKILDQMRDAENKAWEALSGYKFWMFGYHAARWVTYNRLLHTPQPSPFTNLVKLARDMIDNQPTSPSPPRYEKRGQGRYERESPH